MLSSMDDAEVASEIVSGFAGGWNKHDMSALGAVFHDDASFVNVIGTYMRGRADIERNHGFAHAGPYRNSTLGMEVLDARQVVPGLIVAHVRTEVRGDERAPGQVRPALLTFVIERRADVWKIIAAHNTIVVAPAG
jgi:uncharacterized protein (TIGR02246 family)